MCLFLEVGFVWALIVFLKQWRFKECSYREFEALDTLCPAAGLSALASLSPYPPAQPTGRRGGGARSTLCGAEAVLFSPDLLAGTS